jgi:very-short-patch-repair endonuclease
MRYSKFNKFYGDHYNKFNSIKKKPKEKTKEEKKIDIIKRLKIINTSIEDITNLYVDYINYKVSMPYISEKICLDKRTIIGYWNLLNLIENKDDFKRIAKKHQTLWMLKISDKRHIDENILIDIKMFIDNNPNKFTLKEIINKFNLENISKMVLYDRLCRNFDETDIKSKLNTGNVSKPELEYFNILKYFYKNEIKQQFRLENKFYDYILSDKILIEFDGKYWHSSPEKIIQDKEKDNIAKKNGYYIIRVSDKESNNIEILNKINKLYEKVKNSKNKK